MDTAETLERIEQFHDSPEFDDVVDKIESMKALVDDGELNVSNNDLEAIKSRIPITAWGWNRSAPSWGG